MADDHNITTPNRSNLSINATLVSERFQNYQECYIFLKIGGRKVEMPSVNRNSDEDQGYSRAILSTERGPL